jgi:peptidoglycan/xylan/chitin deacetylase (PgdA/CDA1 family)
MTPPPILPPPTSPRVWHLTPLLAATLLIHGGALVAVMLHPLTWPWALLAICVSHLALTAAGLWPRSRLLGPTWVHLPPAALARGEIARTLDDGPDPEVTPAVLDLLDRHQVRATFFCIGERAAAHPELVADIVRRGHALENHSHFHRHHFSLFGPTRMRDDIARAQTTLAHFDTRSPQFFRAPAGLRNPFLEPVLAALGLTLTSWTKRGFDTRESRADLVLARLTHQLAAGDILLLHDGNAARDAAGQPVILAVLPPLLDAIAHAGLTPVTLNQALR